MAHLFSDVGQLEVVVVVHPLPDDVLHETERGLISDVRGLILPWPLNG